MPQGIPIDYNPSQEEIETYTRVFKEQQLKALKARKPKYQEFQPNVYRVCHSSIGEEG